MLTNFETTLSQKTQLSSNVCLFRFDLEEPKEITFKAGQYLILKIPSGEGLVSRLYSIASPDTKKNSFDLTVEIVPGGLASSYLSDLKVKEAVVFQGPAGMFGLKENNRPKIFLVTGTGIAPVKSMLESYQLPVTSYQLFWGLKTYKDVYLLDELKRFNLKICLSREKNLDIIPEKNRKYFEIGHVDKCLTENFQNYDFYLCGRRETVESLKQFLLGKNVLQENIIFEKF